jgi:hypothetical protein
MPNLQILHDDDRVIFASLSREFMQEIVAAIGNVDVKLGDALLLFLPILRVLHHACELALHAGFLFLNTPIGIEGRIQSAIGECRERGDT